MRIAAADDNVYRQMSQVRQGNSPQCLCGFVVRIAAAHEDDDTRQGFALPCQRARTELREVRPDQREFRPEEQRAASRCQSPVVRMYWISVILVEQEVAIMLS